MTAADFQALLPFMCVAAAAVIVMLVISFYRNQTLSAILTLAGLLVALASLPIAWSHAPRAIPPLLRVDSFALVHLALLLVGTVAVTVFSQRYLEKYRMERGEFYILLLLSALGALILAAADHFVAFFLGLELLSVSLYVMVGYIFVKEKALEAAVKYLFLAGLTSALLLFGLALIYAALGSMEFSALAAAVAGAPDGLSPFLVAGMLLVFAGAAFKLSVVPFHLWTPDIYQGAPAPVTAFLATVSKGCVVAVLLRFFAPLDPASQTGLFSALAAVAGASMIVGNLLALLQDNLKRILAYSSIAHFGYILVAFLAGGENGPAAATFYLVTYFAATLIAFGVIGYLSPTDQEADTVADYRGLFWRRPGSAALLSIAIFSLLGLPLTAGFMGKFFLVAAGAAAGLWPLLIILTVSATLGIFYYLRIIIAMYSGEGRKSEGRTADAPFAPTSATVLVLLAVLLIVIGIAPEPLLAFIQAATTLAP
ncbi:MAG: NADH-quinone oxidoreductase subunit N [Puniceicoccaceae bacterium]|nr:MAG: NADH-quinone oxidoreductase subunit N [Puniceicoccaceae bacterium]